MDSMFKSREQEQVKASNPMGLSRTEIKLDVNKDPDAEALKMLKRPHSKKYMKAQFKNFFTILKLKEILLKILILIYYLKYI